MFIKDKVREVCACASTISEVPTDTRTADAILKETEKKIKNCYNLKKDLKWVLLRVITFWIKASYLRVTDCNIEKPSTGDLERLTFHTNYNDKDEAISS